MASKILVKNNMLTDRLQQLNQLNETKGQELTVLSQIPEFRKEAEVQQDWSMVAQSYWQEHLAHQHLVMNDQDPDNIHRQAMLSSAISAHQVVVEHQLDSLLGSSHRFLGRAYSYQSQHQEAQTHYQTAIDILTKDQDPRSLEVAGFLAESLVRNGEIEKGLALAYSTFDSYDSDPLAQILKKSDEYVFLVWRTGIFPRLVTALADTKAEYDHQRVGEYLKKSEAMLLDKSKFAYRVAEIARALSTLLTAIFAFIPSLLHLRS